MVHAKEQNQCSRHRSYYYFVVIVVVLSWTVKGGDWTAWRIQSRSPEMTRGMGGLLLGTSEPPHPEDMGSGLT